MIPVQFDYLAPTSVEEALAALAEHGDEAKILAGGQTLLPTMKREPEWVPTGFGNATNYGANKLRFVSPVPAGAKIHSHSRLLDIEAKPKGTQVTQEIQVHVVGQDKPALIYEMVVLYHPAMKRG